MMQVQPTFLERTFNSPTFTLLGMKPRFLLVQLIGFFMIISTALIIWKSLIVITNTESPVVVVLSGSMEPAYYRGDLLFLSESSKDYKTGDVLVFEIEGRGIPIVHRIIRVHQKPGAPPKKEIIKSAWWKFLEDDTVYPSVEILTKGDNNAVDDLSLYNRGQKWIVNKHVIGRIKGYLPYIGYVTILMNDFPILKYLLILSLGLLVILFKE
eukprot:TRINITY_DN12732_c0_g1_i1.p1 TRINITY_DN12732_c0_g1~~TRINITY_DN12732_c0_g1_i1.p1  ORF type:complete len:211 (-),score=72.21 TRINITY_DN12732_c0_g1_i1:211-843(-)